MSKNNPVPLAFETKDQRIFVSGSLGFANATATLTEKPKLQSNGEAVDLDLSALSHIDSAGVSVLLHWAREAKKEGVELRLFGVPKSVHSLIEIAGLDSLLDEE